MFNSPMILTGSFVANVKSKNLKKVVYLPYGLKVYLYSIKIFPIGFYIYLNLIDIKYWCSFQLFTDLTCFNLKH